MDITFFLSLFLFGVWIARKLLVRVRAMSNVPSYIGDSVHFALGLFASRQDVAVAFLISWLYVMYQVLDYVENKSTVSKDVATYLAGLATGYGFSFI